MVEHWGVVSVVSNKRHICIMWSLLIVLQLKPTQYANLLGGPYVSRQTEVMLSSEKA